MKDMPSYLPEGLKFAHSPKREDPRDALIFKEGYKSLDDLPQGARIGTGSKRRKYQLLKHRPDLEIVPIRGNIETRIKKIETGLGTISIAKNPISVEIENEEEVPNEFKTIITTTKIDKTKIKDNFKETGEIPDGVKINTENTSLRIK